MVIVSFRENQVHGIRKSNDRVIREYIQHGSKNTNCVVVYSMVHLLLGQWSANENGICDELEISLSLYIHMKEYIERDIEISLSIYRDFPVSFSLYM